MTRSVYKLWLAGFGGLALTLAGAAPLSAAPGDIHRITADLANLRAGPSNDAAVRGQVEAGTQVIELRSERNWLGVRVLDTGEEGWIFGDLVERVARSDLAAEPGDAGFRQLSESFDRLVQSLNDQLGYPLVEQVERTADDALTVTPTPQWLRYSGRDAHMMAAMAFYQMWKNHQDQRPVRLTLLGPEGDDYITITDEDVGPVLSLRAPGEEETAG
jgi:hypothetical protein